MHNPIRDDNPTHSNDMHNDNDMHTRRKNPDDQSNHQDDNKYHNQSSSHDHNKYHDQSSPHDHNKHYNQSDHHDHNKHHDHSNHGHLHAPLSFNAAFGIAVTLNFAFTLFQLAFAFIAHSMSLMADAIHNFGDVFGLILAWGANWLLTKPARKRYSY